MRRRLKWIIYALIILAGLVMSYGLLLARPEPFFVYQLKDRNFIFYSNRPIDPRIRRLTDAVNAKLERSEIFDQSIQFRVFIVGSKLLYVFLNGPYSSAIARNYEIGNPIFIPMLDMDHEEIVHFDGHRANAAHILAHEAVHTLMAHRLGMFRVWALPWWKREGYPEYIASDCSRRSNAPARYQQALVKVAELMEAQRLDFDGMINEN